jgi:hypothetical protein
MPPPRKQYIRFRPVQLSDAAYISKWLAEALYKSPEWERYFLRTLIDEWYRTDKLSRPTSWMATLGNRRLFFLEIVEEDHVFLTAPRTLHSNHTQALNAWQHIITYLRRLAAVPRIRVTLDLTREVECACLFQLGFTEISTNGTTRTFLLIW